ncbi:hypothetical protein EVAR_79504_1 [Eumeta japonica]|uniref:Uncharacterized protein n=1 Tax=Eumeta variegata TaxID=151549 RepID=A0A4C1UDT0_EUMVA|nr:hypothetical protein EVAR_79504_1 [Eumeta japonica]
MYHTPLSPYRALNLNMVLRYSTEPLSYTEDFARCEPANGEIPNSDRESPRANVILISERQKGSRAGANSISRAIILFRSGVTLQLEKESLEVASRG